MRPREYSRAPNAEHLRDEFLRQVELVAADAVVRHQQPPADAFFDRVRLIADERLRDLVGERMGETLHDLIERSAAAELGAQVLHHDAQEVAAALNHASRRASIRTEGDEATGDALIADGTDLDGMAFLGRADEGHHSRQGKVRRLDWAIGLKKHRSGSESQRVALFHEPCALGLRQ